MTSIWNMAAKILSATAGSMVVGGHEHIVRHLTDVAFMEVGREGLELFFLFLGRHLRQVASALEDFKGLIRRTRDLTLNLGFRTPVSIEVWVDAVIPENARK